MDQSPPHTLFGFIKEKRRGEADWNLQHPCKHVCEEKRCAAHLVWYKIS